MPKTITVTTESLDDEFEARGWTDGLPIVAPTYARVAAMLAFSAQDANAELGTMPPRQGIVTPEILAVNAVMAGCRPEYFPVVIAAVKAMLDPAFNLFAVQATTHPCAPCVIVNGPIASELNINSRYGAFGPGTRANATIGRAVRLILLNVGGATPGVLDRSTQGQPAKYAFCVAENEAESPWPPLHVERGFSAETSTVTVTAAEGPHNLNDHVSAKAAGILATLTGALADMGCNNAYLYGQPTIAFGPEHAAILAADGVTKDDIRQHVFEHARLPRSLWQRGGMAGMFDDRFPLDEFVPIIKSPQDLLIIVVGGYGRHSCWLPTFGDTTRAVTRAIVRADQPVGCTAFSKGSTNGQTARITGIPMITWADIIGLWQSPIDLARDMGTNHREVSAWKLRRGVPVSRWDELLAAAERRQIGLNLSMLWAARGNGRAD